ncbi:MAG: DivIVA domain-containing protein [Ilumatobacteraceae bacterium]
MAISFSRPDPSSPDAVARATFSTARRGFDQTEVRDLLRMVAAELARLQERERFLDRELRTAQRGAPAPVVALDEEVVTRMLGEEAARILTTSREAASQIKIRAEESAARLLREATDEAQRVREEAAVEAARRRQDASADAESELEMAKQQGREMVNEARAYRERVLSELARRREMARKQIEQLVHGRDRLLQAFERARLAAVDVMAEMTPLGEPSEYVNLTPTTGPLPVMLPNQPPPRPQPRLVSTTMAPAAAPYDHRTAEASTDRGSGDDTVALMREGHDDRAAPDRDRRSATVVSLFAGELLVDEPPVEPAESEVAVEPEVAVEQSEVEPTEAEQREVEQSEDAENTEVAETELADNVVADTVVAEPLSAKPETGESEAQAEEAQAEEAQAEDAQAEVVEVEPETEVGVGEAAAEPAAAVGEAIDADAAAVDDLFARLRAARAASVAERSRMLDDLPADSAGARASRPVASSPIVAQTPDDDATRSLLRPEDLSVFAPSPDAPNDPGEADDSPFGRRDASLTPLIVAGARKLKRILADEQNDVLHTLRRADPVVELDAMLAPEAEHSRHYVAAIEHELQAAVAEGAASVDTRLTDVRLGDEARDGAVQQAVAELSTTIVAPLRERLARAVVDAAADNEELAALVRGIYREWKIQRIDEHLDEVVRIAFGWGALAGVKPGAPVKWVHDPRFPVCADCDDNALTGVIGAGSPFATGRPCAPAHEGCRCMLVAAGS